MSNQDVPDEIEYWIVRRQKGNKKVYAKVSEFAKAGEKLIQVDSEHIKVDYVLKPIYIND